MIVRALHSNWFDYPRPRLSVASQVAPFDVLRSELGRLFAGYGYPWDATCAGSASTGVDFEFKDEGSRLTLSARLPGIAEKDLELKVTADGLVIKAERKVSVPEGYRARRRERQSYSFERALRFPVKVDPDKSEASLVNGVLTVTLPKAEAATPRSITVRSS